MKITIEELVPYLPYGLEFICICPESMEYEISCATNIHLANEIIEVGATEFEFSDLGGKELKPILRPISDLVKEIEHNGEKFVPVEHFEIGDDDSGYHIDFGNGNVGLIKDLEFCAKYNDWHDLQFVPAIVHKQLIKWHFDVFGLIEKGLAVNINEI